MKPYTLLLTLLFVITTGVAFADKELQTIDRTYEPNIRTALLHPYTGDLKDVLQPAIISLLDRRQLLLSFDELGNNSESYYVKILNCNADWTLSDLNPIMFLSDYNEFQIQDRQASYNTRVPYIHYKFFLPRVKISGNFLVLVYRNADDQDIILTRRFMVYDNAVAILPQVKFPMSGVERNTGQQADFTINFGNNIVNPTDRLKVVIRQNYNWNNVISGLNPPYMREGSFEYSFFNNENVFKGLNEFRFFDLRSLKSNGMNVNRIQEFSDRNEVLLGFDRTRRMEGYSTSIDLNGFFVPEQYETKGFETEPDYAKVTFTLEIKPEDAKGRIFIMGSLSDWALNSDFEMKYDAASGKYLCTVLLKQGYYNYRYAFLPAGSNTADESYLEGSYSNTENIYDFIVYYRAPGGMYDQILGYKMADYLAAR